MLRHNCGLVVAHTLHDTYSMIKSLQHRGREAAGIAAIGESIDVIKWEGTVDRFDLVDLHKIFSKHYHTYFAHVRYATTGRKDKLLDDAHPHVIGGQVQYNDTHMLILDCDMACVHNGQVDEKYYDTIDKKMLTTDCDTESLLHFYKAYGEEELLRRVPGAYTLALADKRRKEVIVLRDRTGIRPGIIGWKDGRYGIASEDIAFRKNGGEFVDEICAGAAYYFKPTGEFSKKQVTNPKPAPCFFEWNYLADRDSVLNGKAVRNVREMLGEKLAEECNPPAELVSYLPRCPEVAARSYAKKTNKTFLPIFYKTRSERAFQGSTTEERKKSIEQNLYVLPGLDHILKDQKIILIDDSIIRGNNLKRARYLLRNSGVREIFFLSYTPPIGITGADGVQRGCTYGIDMPPSDAFIARGRTLDEISKEAGVIVYYLSTKGMLDVYKQLGVYSMCTFCIGGQDPLEK